MLRKDTGISILQGINKSYEKNSIIATPGIYKKVFHENAVV